MTPQRELQLTLGLSAMGAVALLASVALVGDLHRWIRQREPQLERWLWPQTPQPGHAQPQQLLRSAHGEPLRSGESRQCGRVWQEGGLDSKPLQAWQRCQCLSQFL